MATPTTSITTNQLEHIKKKAGTATLETDNEGHPRLIGVAQDLARVVWSCAEALDPEDKAAATTIEQIPLAGGDVELAFTWTAIYVIND